MRNFSKRKGVVFVYVMVVMVLSIIVASPNVTHADILTTRIIKLELPEGTTTSYKPGMFGTVIMRAVPPNYTVMEFQLNIKGLPCMKGGEWNRYYALYVWTPSKERIRLFNFNTDCISGTFNSLIFTSGADEFWFTDEITFEVWSESDDGSDSPDVGFPHHIILIGED